MVPSRAPKEDGDVGLKAKHCRIIFVKGFDSGTFSVEEMLPVNSDWVPDEENVGIMRCCPPMLTAFQRGRGI